MGYYQKQDKKNRLTPPSKPIEAHKDRGAGFTHFDGDGCSPAPLEADKELDEILSDVCTIEDGGRPCALHKTDAKTALQAWRDKAVVAARISQTEKIKDWLSIEDYYVPGFLESELRHLRGEWS